jgi:hypothetical protein
LFFNFIKFYLNIFQNFELSTPPTILDGISTCRNFINNIVTGKTSKFSVLYYDLRQNNPNILDTELKIFRKQLGAVIRDKNDFEIIVKTGHDDPYKKIKIKPDHPEDFELPPLVELLNAETHPQHEETRWKFLKWIILSSENREIEKVPQKFLVDILILIFLTREGFLTIFEADLILLSIKISQDGNYEKSLDEIPEILDPRAFKVSFLFTKFFQPVTRCLKLAGLGKLKVRLNLIEY